MLEKLEAADMPAEIKEPLTEVINAFESICPDLDKLQAIYISMMAGLVIEEIADPSVETHWWEMVFDCLRKAAQSQEGAGRELLEGIEKLSLLLPAHMNTGDEVSLKEITGETVRGICLLSDTLTPPRKYFVAPNAVSLAQAHFSPHAWFRAVYAGKAPVGFMMIADNPEEEQYFLWRFMIGEPFHGRGYGAAAIKELAAYVKTRPGAKVLGVSCGQGEGSPEDFYLKQGFVPTGEWYGEEKVLNLNLE